MKIIKQGNCNKNPIKQFECPNCGCVFEIDSRIENLSSCPCCSADVSDLSAMISSESGTEFKKPKTPDEVFPDKYYKCGFNDEEKILGLQETQTLIKKCIDVYFSEGGGYASLSYGDTLVFITQNDKQAINDYKVVVTKNYYTLDSYELTE